MPAKVFIEVAPRFELDGSVIKVWHRMKGKDGEIVETGSCSFATLHVALAFQAGLKAVIDKAMHEQEATILEFRRADSG